MKFKPGDVVRGRSIRPSEICEILGPYEFGTSPDCYLAKITHAEGQVSYRIVVGGNLSLSTAAATATQSQPVAAFKVGDHVVLKPSVRWCGYNLGGMQGTVTHVTVMGIRVETPGAPTPQVIVMADELDLLERPRVSRSRLTEVQEGGKRFYRMVVS